MASEQPPTADRRQLEGESANELAELGAENQLLKAQVRDLMAAENKLYVLQDHLNAQQRVYVRLADLGRTLNATFDVSEILEKVVNFVVYGFSYERGLGFLSDEKGSLRLVAHEGYYDEAEVAQLTQTKLTGAEPGISGIDAEPGFICHAAETQNPHTRALGGLFLLDEYFVFALPGKDGGLRGLVIGGNTSERARFQTGVESDGEMLVAFSNLAAQTAAVINTIDSFHALERERQLLDGMVADRTQELSEALDAAHEAVRVKSEFLANVSHELRTPLNSIVNVPPALLRDYPAITVYTCAACDTHFEFDGQETKLTCPDCGQPLVTRESTVFVGEPEEHRRFLRLLGQQGKHLLQLVEDVLDFSRVDSGNIDLNVTIVDVGELLEEVRDTLESSAHGNECPVHYPTLETPLTFVADKLRVKQILLNLIGNALKFTPAEGQVAVTVRQLSEPDASIEFHVIDRGVGIPEDQLDAIFESFHQVDGSHTRNYAGVGLGLAICRQLVELHGGTITVQSKPGEGADFRFVLPANQAVARSPSPVENEIRPSQADLDATHRGHGQVVVVDDEPSQLSIARRILEREGYDVVLARTAQSALELIRQRPPRFALLDVMMPEFDGLWLLNQLKTDPATRHIPVIVSSGYPYNRAKAEAGGAVWLPKPWNLQKLSAVTIEAALATALGQSDADQGSPHEQGVKRTRTARLSDLVSRILYVEDEDANWEVTQLSLRGKYQLTRARTSEEAFRLIADNTFDLVLMDIQLKGSELNGIEACEILTGKRTVDVPEYAKEVRYEGPIVVVTAYAALHNKKDIQRSGARELVSKPVDFTHLLMVLSRIVVEGAVSQIHAAE